MASTSVVSWCPSLSESASAAPKRPRYASANGLRSHCAKYVASGSPSAPFRACGKLRVHPCGGASPIPSSGPAYDDAGSMRSHVFPKSEVIGFASMNAFTVGFGPSAYTDDVSQPSRPLVSHVTTSPPWPASMIALRAFSDNATMCAPRSVRI